MSNSTFIANNEMEQIAETVLSKAGVSTEWQGIINKTDIDALIEFEYGLEIQWENIDHFASDGIVLAAIVPKKKLIYMNESQKDLFMEKMGTMNFSKAHELGHWILHVVHMQNYEQLSFNEGETYYCRSAFKRAPEEIQADMFAAAILMPKKVISGVIKDIKTQRKVTFPDLYRIKDDLEVSISALVTRINALDLLYIEDGNVYSNKQEATGQMSLF